MNKKVRRWANASSFAVAIALLLGGGQAVAADKATAGNVSEVTQQSLTVNGVVTDNAGDPVTGASVVEKGTSNGVITDISGKFTLRVKPGATLKVSFVGYQTQEVKAASSVAVTLKEDAALLDEVVVVGYGTQKKVNLTGAVTAVDLDKTMAGRPQQDVSKALQGAVPGLTITTANGDINSSASMRIRGIGTLSNSQVSNPLIVVDGVPMDDISFLNTQDIESISVLKDAASSSIYGTRAAFGVILINTKSAKPQERVSINYSNNFAWDQATYLPNFGSVPSQVRASLEAGANMGVYDGELFGMYYNQLLPLAEKWVQQNGNKKLGYGELRPYVDENNIGDYQVINGVPYFYADWDVQDIYYNRAAPSQSHNLSAQGTSGKTSYYLSFGYDDKRGTMKVRPDELKKYNISANVTSNIFSWLQVGARINHTRKIYERPEVWSGTESTMWRWGSYFIPSGTIDGYDTRLMAFRKQASNRVYNIDLTRMNGFLKADIVKGLTFNTDFTYTILNNSVGFEDFPVYGVEWGQYKPSMLVKQTSTSARREHTKRNTWTLNAYLNYGATFAKAHNLNVMVGANAEKIDDRYMWINRNELLDMGYPELNLTSTDGQSTGWSHWQRATAGYFGRINYDYKGIYLLELNGRYDGSSRFPRTQHWAFFPSGSIGYRISEEAFFEPLKKVVSNAKVRASYGEIGNEAVGDNMFVELVSQMAAGSVYWVDSNATNANKLTVYNMPSLVSKTLTWERIRTTDVGLDLGFMNNELTVGFDWYQRENLDMLAPAKTLPNTVGATAPYENAGSLRTRGWEVTLDWRHTFGEVDLYANFNIGDSKTVVTKWDNDTKNINGTYTGKVWGDIWGFETDRYFELSDFDGQNADGTWNYKPGIANQSALESGAFHYGPGDIKFKDLDGDGKIDGGKGTEDDHGDLKVIGNSLPRYEYAFHIGGSYKGFDLDLFFQGVGKRDSWNISTFNFPMMRSADWALYSHQDSYNRVYYTDDWKTVTGYDIDQNNKYPRLYAGNEAQGTVPGISAGKNNYYPQSRYLMNLSYLRLKNVTLGYTLPRDLTRKAFIDKARIYVSGSNLFLLHKGNGDLPLDPEINYAPGGGETWGRTIPITRTYSFGIQVTL